jgi:cytochrome c biogenesis protein CcdA
MGFGLATYTIGYLAGVLSTLSPCVLPLLPIVLGSAVTASRFGPFALTAGVMLSFSAVGIFLATAGAGLGLNEDSFRNVAAVLLVLAGTVLMVPALQRRLALLASGASSAGHAFLARLSFGGSGGQFVIGLVLGAVWSPCVGPTLGAAIALASQGKDLLKVAMLMAIYGLGAGTPMLVLGSLSRSVASRFRGKLMSIGHVGKYVLGAVIFLLGAATLTGLDKTLESVAVEHSPAWLTNLTTGI